MTQKKNICISITSLAVGGAEKQCLLLATVLREQYNTQVVVINDSPKYQGHLDFIKKEKVKCTFLTGNTISRLRQYTRLLKEQQIHLCFAYLPTDVVYTTIAARQAKIPYVIGGIRNAKMARMKSLILKFIHNGFLDYSISNSQSGIPFFKKVGFDTDKIQVIHNGIRINKQTTQRLENKTEVIITSVGRFVEQKDYRTALHAIALLKTMPLSYSIKYWIIGHGELEQQIRNLITELDLESIVKIHIRPNNIPDLYQQADIYLCTSTFEGLSNSIMEAMNFSLPLVATNAGDNDKLVSNGINGYITPLEDVKQIASYLQLLINDEQKRLTMGQESYSILTEKYSIPAFKKNYSNFLNTIFEQKKNLNSKKITNI